MAAKKKGSGIKLAAALGVGAALLGGAGHGHGKGILADLTSAGGPSASQAIAYEKQQLGCPYVWGGTGPCASGYDCSGLVYEAYGLPSSLRTSEEQWAGLPHVATPVRGDLVFFAGADGTPSDPGHVGTVLNPAKHTMIEAYASGVPVRISTYGLPSSASGDTNPVGFANPGGA